MGAALRLPWTVFSRRLTTNFMWRWSTHDHHVYMLCYANNLQREHINFHYNSTLKQISIIILWDCAFNSTGYWNFIDFYCLMQDTSNFCLEEILQNKSSVLMISYNCYPWQPWLPNNTKCFVKNWQLEFLVWSNGGDSTWYFICWVTDRATYNYNS